jgi:AhpD family alkylhydroperoxidase
MTPCMTDPVKHAEPDFRALFALEAAIMASVLAPGPLHLIKLRASQISGCAIRGHMHTGEAIKDGETDLRLRMLVARRESSL